MFLMNVIGYLIRKYILPYEVIFSFSYFFSTPRLFDANTHVKKSLYISYTHKPLSKTSADMCLDLIARKGTKTRHLIFPGKNGAPTKPLEGECISRNDEHHDTEGKTQSKRRKEEGSVVECRPFSKDDVKRLLKNFEYQTQSNGWETR